MSTLDQRLKAFESEMIEMGTAMAHLLTRKRRMYGETNLDLFGSMGILIRASDKVYRLKSLMEDPHSPIDAGDSYEDAWRDLIGYAMLGLYYFRREHPSKLAVDSPEFKTFLDKITEDPGALSVSRYAFGVQSDPGDES